MLHQRLSAKVRVRFAMNMDEFVDRVRSLAHRQTSLTPDAFVDRLEADDLYLATSCAAGDEAAWNEFGDRFFPFIRDFARRAIQNAAAADVADQLIADLWQRGKISQYEGRSTLKTWLGAIVSRASINAAKQQRAEEKRERSIQLAAPRPGAPAVEPVVVKDASARLLRWVADAIRGLPAGDRLLLLLYYEQEMTLEDISRIVHRSKAVLSRRLARLRAELRREVERQATQSTGGPAGATREAIDLARVEFDLSAIFSRAKKNSENTV